METSPVQILSREIGQSFPGMIFVFTDDENNMRTLVCFESLRLSTDKIDAGDGGAPVFFNMTNEQISARKMVHVWRHTRVVHRVRHVTHEDHIFALHNHLAN